VLSVFFVKHKLMEDGFKEVNEETELINKTFLSDDQFYDVLSFPHEMLTFLEHYSMVTDGLLVIQVNYYEHVVTNGILVIQVNYYEHVVTNGILVIQVNYYETYPRIGL